MEGFILDPESHSTQPAVKSGLKCITLQRIKENAISHTIKKRQSTIRAIAIKTCTLTELFHESAKHSGNISEDHRAVSMPLIYFLFKKKNKRKLGRVSGLLIMMFIIVRRIVLRIELNKPVKL